MSKEKLYFPNLNGIRCITSLFLIMHHIEVIKSFYNIENYWKTSKFVQVVGHLGVISFFVLSGFLITYLLLKEEDVNDKISIKQFYIRRILRIWPLYFLIIALAFFIFPYFDFFTWPIYNKQYFTDNFYPNILLFLFFLGNTVTVLIPYASQTWSIGTEEQFYIIWPVLIRYTKKHRTMVLSLIIIIYIIIKLILNSHFLGDFSHKTQITFFWNLFSIDCMAWGGLLAIVSFQKNKVLAILMNNKFFYFILLGTLILAGFGHHFPVLHDEFYAVLFGILILNFATNESIKLSLENKAFNYLGNISYGLYMFHPIAITIAIQLSMQLDLVSNYFIYPLVYAITFLLSGLSYHFFESKFLSLKEKFSTILSGDNNKNTNKIT